MNQNQQYQAQRAAFFASINSPIGQGPKAADQVVHAHKAAYGSATTDIGRHIANTQKRTNGGVTKVSKRAWRKYEPNKTAKSMSNAEFDELMSLTRRLNDLGQTEAASKVMNGRALAHIRQHGWRD